MLQHVALAQQLQGDLAADLVAVGGVVDALLGERIGQLGEREAVALGDVLQRRVHLFVGHLDARLVGPLHLQLLQHEPLEHLLAQHVLRRQLELLLVQPLAHRRHLRVEVAVEHHAVVHDGDDAVEHVPLGGQFARLGAPGRPVECEQGHACGAGENRQKPTHDQRVPYQMVFRGP